MVRRSSLQPSRGGAFLSSCGRLTVLDYAYFLRFVCFWNARCLVMFEITCSHSMPLSEGCQQRLTALSCPANRHSQVHDVEKKHACTVQEATGVEEGAAVLSTICVELANWRSRVKLCLRFRVATEFACCVGGPIVEVRRLVREDNSCGHFYIITNEAYT